MIFCNPHKQKLKRVFRNAHLYKEVSTGKKKYQVYPYIIDYRSTEDKTTFVFTLPDGVDPKQIQKQWFVFQQIFGDNIDISGEYKKFVLSIHKYSMPSGVEYNFENFKLKKYDLPIICGVDRHGKMRLYDMENHPHLLIAGETGSGKSTQLRAILSTLVKHYSSDDLRLVLGDLKRSEFHVFRRLPHVEGVCTSSITLDGYLAYVNDILKKRGDLLDKHEKAHIKDLPFHLPSIVVCIDEVALLKDEKDIMSTIEDISAIGRALGVYLILSMQRPDSDILDGKLKNNLTIRMAFKHADRINSNITLGRTVENAADISINTPGRMYMKSDDIELLQGPFLDLEVAKVILEPLKVPKSANQDEQSSVDDNPFNVLGDDDETT
ncbi:FtsK/SpoIIIE domain-containing protein [Tuberibacillus sp. Marseille-P3662]|uniref:FtsK/SpoIIIE domain-containing protein n=1 Tax=Tuberibacillus sp. Marseille-P3662 TaxID=1965358 RepID=UPI000A1CA15F|nr:FtsK/SpoIIIE domain-containing protein [Tuberibacillus sp. Marseille-P3662]